MVKQGVDTLIVGGGLAGSILAWKLMQQGSRTHIVFEPSIPAASNVAAGLINPVTGQRLVLQDNVENLLEACKTFYQSLETHFNMSLYFEKPMLRYLRHRKEEIAWQKRQKNPEYNDYLEATNSSNAILQYHTAYLDIRTLLYQLHHEFKHRRMLSYSTMQYDDIDIQSDYIAWRHITAKRIVFCEGWRGQSNPWFQYLPFQPAKGEILDLKTSSKLPEYIINSGRWLLATDDGRLRLGASYDCQKPLHESISLEAKQGLLADLEQMPIQLDNIEVIQQHVGIRPNTLDKQPFLGFHPKHPNLGIFNGFGSKGSMMIPYYAQCLITSMQEQAALPKIADIRRFTCV